MKLLRPDRDGAEEAVALLARAFRRARGEYREDEWGFDREFAESALPAFEFLFERWWRVEVEGIENLPGQGRTMIVANHSGAVFPFDAIMIGTAIQNERARQTSAPSAIPPTMDRSASGIGLL